MKWLISLILRKVPRKYLQYVSHIFLKMLIPFYWGNNVQCPIDGKTYRKFLPYGRLHPRPNALCPSSLSLERHRLIWLYLQDKTNFFSAKLKVLHIAPELCFIKKFKALPNLEYTTADLDSPLADVKLDVHQIPYSENTFDVVFCNHVMEHVDHDIEAMKEILRILKPGGWAIIQSPVYPELPHTLEDPSIIAPAEREKIYGQNDHQRKYGRDYGDRLRKAGFQVTEDHYVQQLETWKVNQYALPLDEIIYFCKKG